MTKKFFMLGLSIMILSIGSVSAQVRQISSESDLQTALANAKKNKQTTAIKFYSKSCPHCKKFAKPYEQASNNNNNTVFLAVDILKNTGLAQQYNIQGVPTTIIIKPDGTQSTVSGADVKALNKALS